MGKWVLWNEMMSQKVGADVTFILVLDIDVAKYCRGTGATGHGNF